MLTAEGNVEMDHDGELSSDLGTAALVKQSAENASDEEQLQVGMNHEDLTLPGPDLELFVIGERPVIDYSKSATSNPSNNSLKHRMGLDTFQYAQKPFTKLLKALPLEAIPSRVYGYGSTSCGQVLPIAETKININFDAKAGQKWITSFDGQILLQYGLDLKLDMTLKESKGWCVMPISENGCYVGNTFVPQNSCMGLASKDLLRSGEWTCLLQFL